MFFSVFSSSLTHSITHLFYLTHSVNHMCFSLLLFIISLNKFLLAFIAYTHKTFITRGGSYHVVVHMGKGYIIKRGGIIWEKAIIRGGSITKGGRLSCIQWTRYSRGDVGGVEGGDSRGKRRAKGSMGGEAQTHIMGGRLFVCSLSDHIAIYAGACRVAQPLLHHALNVWWQCRCCISNNICRGMQGTTTIMTIYRTTADVILIISYFVDACTTTAREEFILLQEVEVIVLKEEEVIILKEEEYPYRRRHWVCYSSKEGILIVRGGRKEVWDKRPRPPNPGCMQGCTEFIASCMEFLVAIQRLHSNIRNKVSLATGLLHLITILLLRKPTKIIGRFIDDGKCGKKSVLIYQLVVFDYYLVVCASPVRVSLVKYNSSRSQQQLSRQLIINKFF
ncbi:hypothetical protein VP01_1892g2 [Puccinia sorghi]|uniref:Uncharacterized protein n=1 Tax=Puccinia sorghi TaxID=27349 RepID=A0A0L6VCW4_9BASI|nr:hypothetical protein VP01_1892g2 [Puccinia sorghi]